MKQFTITVGISDLSCFHTEKGNRCVCIYNVITDHRVHFVALNFYRDQQRLIQDFARGFSPATFKDSCQGN